VTLFRTAAASLKNSRVIRFGLVGAAGYFVNVAALWLVHHLLALNYYASYAPAFFVAVTFTWWGNRVLTFHEHAARENLLVEWAKFFAANLLGFLANYALYATMLRFAPAPLSNPYVAQIAGTLLGMVFNFTLSKRFVFRAAKPSRATSDPRA
jgi:putative flippase GtrA